MLVGDLPCMFLPLSPYRWYSVSGGDPSFAWFSEDAIFGRQLPLTDYHLHPSLKSKSVAWPLIFT